MSFIVPVGQNQQITPQMREDAKAAAASIEGGSGGPWLYLAQADAKVVTERKKAHGGDFVIMDGDNEVCLGSTCMMIVVSQHIRFQYAIEVQEGKKKMRKVVWDAAREAMSKEQGEQADLDWSDPRAAKPYNSFFLIHLDANTIDPHGVKVIRYRTQGQSAKPGKKWVDSIGNLQARGIPMYAQVWELSSKLEENSFGGTKYVPVFKQVGVIDSNHPAYQTLKESHQHAEAMKAQAKSRVFAGDQGGGGGHMTEDDEAERAAIEAADREANAHFATELPVEAVSRTKTVLRPDTLVALSATVKKKWTDIDPLEAQAALAYHRSLLGKVTGEQAARLGDIIEELDDAVSEPPF